MRMRGAGGGEREFGAIGEAWRDAYCAAELGFGNVEGCIAGDRVAGDFEEGNWTINSVVALCEEALIAAPLS